MSWVIAMTVRPAARPRIDDGPDPRDARRRPGRSSARRGRGPPDPSPGRRPARRACGRDRSRSYGFVVALVGETDRRQGLGRRARAVGRREPEVARPEATSRSTERSNSWSSGSWNTNPTVAASRSMGRQPAMARPSSRTSPAAGRSSPMRCLTSVVLPEPFCPTMATGSPGSIDSETPRTASTPFVVAMDEPVDLDADGASRSVVAGGATTAARSAGLGAEDRRARPARLAAEAGGDRPRIEGRRRRDAGGLRQSNESSVRAGRTGRDRPCRARRPGASSGDDPAGVEHQARGPSVRGRSDRARRTGSPSHSRPARRAGRRPPAVPAGSSCAVGSSRTSSVGAHRDDAGDRDPLLLATRQRERLAIRQVGDAETGEDGVDPRVHLLARHAQVLEPERELLADGQLRCRELVGRRREDDPDPAEELRPGAGRRGVDAVDRRRRRRAVARTTRGMNPAATSASVDLPAPVRPATPTRSPAPTARSSRRGSAPAAPDSGPDPGDPESASLDRRRVAPRHRTEPATATTTTATPPTMTRARSQRSPGGSATTP